MVDVPLYSMLPISLGCHMQLYSHYCVNNSCILSCSHPLISLRFSLFSLQATSVAGLKQNSLFGPQRSCWFCCQISAASFGFIVSQLPVFAGFPITSEFAETDYSIITNFQNNVFLFNYLLQSLSIELMLGGFG